VFLFQENLYQDANALLGMAVRLAQTMGFHRDPNHFPYSPWVCEIRRRAWNQLCCLDAMALSFYGAESCLPATSDAQPPRNANDSDWHASWFANPSSVPGSAGITDMSFAIVHRVIADTARVLASVDPMDFEKKEGILRQTESEIHINYLHAMTHSSHKILAAFAEVRIASLRILNRYRQTRKAESQPQDAGKYQ
jgi:hypothetical protein